MDNLWFSGGAYISFILALVASKTLDLCRAFSLYHETPSISSAFSCSVVQGIALHEVSHLSDFPPGDS
jgi:hypothetical protein